jgi:hypothetical protein
MTHKYKVIPEGTTHYEFDSPTRGAGYMKLEVLPVYGGELVPATQWFFWSSEMSRWVRDSEAERRCINLLFRALEYF